METFSFDYGNGRSFLNFQKLLHSILLILLSVFININIVDDRFVSPLEDLSHQYQSYELEETTRVLSIQSKKQEQVHFRICLPFAFDRSLKKATDVFPHHREFLFSTILLNSSLLNLPPPTLV